MSLSAVIGSLRVNLGIDTAAFSDGIAKVEGKLAGVGRSMVKVGAALSVVTTGVAVAIKGNLDAADEMSKAAAKFGVPIETLSRLKYAADLSDVSLESLGTSLGRLSRNMVEAAAGSAGALEAFQGLGVSFQNADGTLRPTVDVLTDVSAAFAAMPDGAAKTAAAMELMGKGGASMIPLLNGGAEALRGMMTEASDLGLTITQETGTAAEEFNDNLTRLGKSLTGVWTQVSAQVAPVLAQISDVVVRLSEGFRSLSPETQKFLSVGTLLAAALGPVLVVLGAVAVAIGAVGLPVAAAIAGIAALTAGVIAFWPQISAAKDAVIAFGTQALDWIKGKIEDVVTSFTNLRERMVEIGGNLLQGLWDGMMAKWEGLKESIGSIATGITDTFRGWWDMHSPSRVFEELGANLMLGLGNGITGTASVVTGALEGMSVGAQNAMQGLLGAGEQVAQGMGQVNNKMLKASQAFGAAQALVNTYIAASQTLADPTLGFWAKLGAVAKVVATGLGFVAAIKGSGSGGGRGSSGGGYSGGSQRVATPAAATAEKAKPPLDVKVQPVDPNAMFSGRALSTLFTSLQREAGDRGLRLTLA